MGRSGGDDVRCLTPDVLAAVAEGYGSDAAREHVASCERCTKVVDLVRRVKLVGLHEIGDALDDIAALIGSILAEPPHRWESIATDPEYHHAEIARCLLAIAIDARTHDGRIAACASAAATVIVDALSVDAQATNDLRFEVWKTHAALLREVGEFSTLRVALARADEAAERTSDVEFARAMMLLSRALIAADPDVWEPDEAFALLDRAEAVFERRNADRFRRARTTRGMLLWRCGRAAEAYAIFRAVAAETPETDVVNHNDALRNLAWSAHDIGNLKEAASIIRKVEEIDRHYGRGLNIARDLWLTAQICQSENDHEMAVAHGQASMLEFEQIGMQAERIRVGLTVVQSFTALESGYEALALCQELATIAIALDRRQPSRRRLLTAEALQYLREAAARAWLTGPAGVDLVSAVRSYVEQISERPPVRFIPPVPLEPM
ncbi:MAG TPA: hypothetical protein VGR02_18765 [Thermoanaerobaculia bacterium]|jgi:tetratricopeptide (TPR) repeat protein|nr:hypothetical protein [Thermoanaerobaculia bacterium]